MKLLTDFDGVLTDLSGEAARVRELFDATLAAAATKADVAEAVAAAAAHLQARPNENGWAWEGRVTAYANEDPFVRVNGLAARLDRLADENAGGAAARVRDGLRANDSAASDFRAVAQAAYMAMTRETAAGKIHPLDPIVPEILGGLMRRGVEIVVVSNSGTDRILALLRGAGMSPIAHGAGDGPLRVRGDAKKFVLGSDPSKRRSFEAGSYVVQIDRPHYETILREERPDFVMGDVFSLDLAAPLALRREGDPALSRARLLLRRRPYTPSWPIAHLDREAAPFRSYVDRLETVPELIR